MKFMHWKEAEARANEIKPELDALTAKVEKDQVEARKEDISAEVRGQIIDGIQKDIKRAGELQVEYDDAISRRDALKADEQRQFGLLDNLSVPRVAARREHNDEDVYASRAYELAWAKFVQKHDDTELRALTSTVTDSNAGVLVPTTLVNKIEDMAKTGGRLVSLCTTTNIRGMNDYPILNSASDPGWHTEAATVAGTTAKKEKDINITTVSIEPQYLAEILRTTKKFEADGITAFWDWLNAEFPDALMRVMDKAILNGPQSGANGIKGILTNTDAKFVQTLANHALSFNTANEAIAKLDDGTENNIAIIMNRATFFSNVMGLKGSDGHPIFQVMTTNFSAPAYLMGGHRVVFSNALPSYDAASADDVYMVAGDWSAMRLNFPLGMNPSFIRDEITEMDKNIVRYRSEIYVGGNITSLGRFVKVTK